MKTSFKLYENVLIGQFIYGLGLRIGKQTQSDCFPAAVNLLQQCPEDTALGDVLLSFPGTLRLIEFQAEDRDKSKERTRQEKLQIILESDDERLQISRRVHWYFEFSPLSPAEVGGFFTPYIEMDFSSKSLPKQAHAINQFIASVADDVLLHPSDDDARIQQEKDYLISVRLCHVGNSSGSGALIVTVGASGGFHYIVVKDMMELHMPLGEWLCHRDQLIKMESRQMIAQREKDLEGAIEMKARHKKTQHQHRGPSL